MDLAALRVFVRASDMRSFSKAAVSLGLTQPTVSRIIGELEAEWDGSLFYRTGRGVTLSELGTEAVSRARFLLREAEQITEDIKAHSRLPSGDVAVGLPPSIVGPTVSELVNELRTDLPGIKLQIYEGFSDQIERWLAEGTIDIGIYSKYREGLYDKTEFLLESQLVLAGLSKDWNLPEEIDFEQLSEFSLVLPAHTNGLRVIVDNIARRMKVRLNVIANADSTIVQKELAARCGCFMIKAPHTIAAEQQQGLFCSSVIRNPFINRHVVLVTGREKPLNRAGREVAVRLTKILRQLPAISPRNKKP
ncbi:LysR family transcriptional regulator [Thalassospira mesophila]|uniref:HTH lysR-type domain-containing protein n=1 Tax=Thalassospira mesophila TaxID=1293891 RepID=A0A1Y2KVU4_9PROT|nr:LysR family transcriptional regulator [Thalassospira mesophila]OSQ36015.1 hypothetical protein TMES_19565 [Thalassospira mesophila]